jgi:peptidoglycan/LPS O-acetylase OafA/YrhL
MAAPVTSRRRLAHVGGLDGLRGLAVLLVLVSHLNLVVRRADLTGFAPVDRLLSGGFLGVDLFFVLSGFLITALLLREVGDTGDVRYGAFYGRRALRLLPPLYLLLLVHAVYTLASDGDWGAEGASIRAAVLYLSNWQVVYSFETVADGTNHLWSLAVEEQFYFLWPALLVGLLGVGLRPRVFAAVLGVVVVATAFHRALLWDHGVDWVELFVRTDLRLDALAIGAALALLWTTGSTPGRGVVAAGWVGAGVIILCVLLSRANEDFFQLGGATLFALGAAAVILAVLDGNWSGIAVLEWRPLRAVGLVSYGLYLWHFPVFTAVGDHGRDLPSVVRVLLALLISVGATLLSWFALERPLRAYRPVPGRREPAPTPADADVAG